jgi:hypothetical protein
MTGIYLPTCRKRVRRVHGSKDKNSKSRVIFNNGKENTLNVVAGSNRNHANVLHSIKNLQFFGEQRKTKVLVQNTYMCNEQLSALDINNKSFDDCNKLIKQRKKNKRRAHTAIRLRNALDENNLISKDCSKVYQSYGLRILKDMMDKEADFFAPKPLANHEISPQLRAKMIDWMIEVFDVYKKEVDSFFLAVYILDNYLARTTNMHGDDDVHLLGLVSMLIASKYSDIEPFCLRDICEKIGHDSYGPKAIRKQEIQMLRTLDYEIEAVTPDYFIQTIMIVLKKNVSYPDNRILYSTLERTSLQYAKMAIIDSEMVEHKPSEIAFASMSNACILLSKDGKFSHKKNKLNEVIGFFQTLFSKAPFNKINIEPIENKLSSFLGSIEEVYPHCQNYRKFSMID